MNLSDEEFLSLSGQMSDRDVMKICGYTKNVSSSRKTNEWVRANVVEKLQRGMFRKLAKAI